MALHAVWFEKVKESKEWAEKSDKLVEDVLVEDPPADHIEEHTAEVPNDAVDSSSNDDVGPGGDEPFGADGGLTPGGDETPGEAVDIGAGMEAFMDEPLPAEEEDSLSVASRGRP